MIIFRNMIPVTSMLQVIPTIRKLLILLRISSIPIQLNHVLLLCTILMTQLAVLSLPETSIIRRIMGRINKNGTRNTGHLQELFDRYDLTLWCRLCHRVFDDITTTTDHPGSRQHNNQRSTKHTRLNTTNHDNFDVGTDSCPNGRQDINRGRGCMCRKQDRLVPNRGTQRIVSVCLLLLFHRAVPSGFHDQITCRCGRRRCGFGMLLAVLRRLVGFYHHGTCRLYLGRSPWVSDDRPLLHRYSW